MFEFGPIRSKFGRACFAVAAVSVYAGCSTAVERLGNPGSGGTSAVDGSSPEAHSGLAPTAGPSTDPSQCLASLTLEEGFNCLGMAPECWTRVTATIDGHVVVTQPPIGDAGTGIRVERQVSSEWQAQLAEWMCAPSLRAAAETQNTCTALCSDVFLTVTITSEDGLSIRDPFGGPCICAIPQHPYTKAYEVLFGGILPEYFPSVRNPPL